VGERRRFYVSPLTRPQTVRAARATVSAGLGHDPASALVTRAQLTWDKRAHRRLSNLRAGPLRITPDPNGRLPHRRGPPHAFQIPRRAFAARISARRRIGTYFGCFREMKQRGARRDDPLVHKRAICRPPHIRERAAEVIRLSLRPKHVPHRCT
jgi:hypothetical protein